MIFACMQLAAQTTAEQYRARYTRLVGSVGADGVGVEHLLKNWGKDFPDDCAMLQGKYYYYYLKSRSEAIEAVDAQKFLGSKPVLSLKDSTGRDVNYFTVPKFDDELFRESQVSIDKAIELKPMELRYRFDKISALADYEKDSPDMAATAMLDLIDLDARTHPEWTLDGEPVSRGDFEDAVQEYCLLFYTIGSPNSYESFRTLAERMLKINPKSTVFLNDIGAYWQVAKRNDKTAAKFYRKTLKIDPEDSAAKTNLAIIERNKKKKK